MEKELYSRAVQTSLFAWELTGCLIRWSEVRSCFENHTFFVLSEKYDPHDYIAFLSFPKSIGQYSPFVSEPPEYTCQLLAKIRNLSESLIPWSQWSIHRRQASCKRKSKGAKWQWIQCNISRLWITSRYGRKTKNTTMQDHDCADSFNQQPILISLEYVNYSINNAIKTSHSSTIPIWWTYPIRQNHSAKAQID